MRLTLSLLGLELDVTFGLAGADEPDPLRDLGTLGHYPVGFTAKHDVPEECPMPQRVPAWDDE